MLLEMLVEKPEVGLTISLEVDEKLKMELPAKA
jgi:hypothetical protein